MYGLEDGRIDPRAFRGPKGGVWDVSYGDGDNLPAVIYEKEVIVNRNARLVNPSYDAPADIQKKLYIKIQLPMVHGAKKGDLLDVELTEQHKRDYPQAWANFQSGKTEAFSGTPLSTWVTPLIDEAKRIDLASLGIVTMEQIRDMSDGSIKALGHHGHWLKKAATDELQRRWQASQKAVAGDQVETLVEQNKALMERLERLEAKDEKPKKSKAKSKAKATVEAAEAGEEADGMGE